MHTTPPKPLLPKCETSIPLIHGRLHEVFFGLHALSGALFVASPLFPVGLGFSLVRFGGSEASSLPVPEFVHVKLVAALHSIRMTYPFRRRRLSVNDKRGETEIENYLEGGKIY